MAEKQGSKFSFRWGVPLLDDDYTRVPNLFFRHYASIGITRQEFLFIMHLASYKYETAKSECRPSLETIATEMGYAHVNGVRKLAQSLQKKGLLVIIPRPGFPNEYNFAALSKALIEAGEQECTPTPQCTPTPEDTPTPTPQCRPPLHPSVGEEKKQEKKGKKSKREPGGSRSANPPKQNRTSQRKAKTKTPPAVLEFRKNTHRYPAKSWYSDVAETVGESEADLQFWGQVVKGWVGCGWSPVNVKGMLEFYRRREIPTTNGGNGRRPGGLAGMKALAQREGWLDGDP